MLEKYKNGVEYLVSDWTGNYVLDVGMIFEGEPDEGKKERHSNAFLTKWY